MTARHPTNGFATSLYEARLVGGYTQETLAYELGVAPSTVGAWETGVSHPPPETVWQIETVLGVIPGFLSRHLGYLPVGEERAHPQRSGFLAALQADPKLPLRQKRWFKEMYEELTRQADDRPTSERASRRNAPSSTKRDRMAQG